MELKKTLMNHRNMFKWQFELIKKMQLMNMLKKLYKKGDKESAKYFKIAVDLQSYRVNNLIFFKMKIPS